MFKKIGATNVRDGIFKYEWNVDRKFFFFFLLHLRYGWAISLSFRGVCVCVRIFSHSSFKTAWVLNSFNKGFNQENFVKCISKIEPLDSYCLWKSCTEKNLFLIFLVVFISVLVYCFRQIINEKWLNGFWELWMA